MQSNNNLPMLASVSAGTVTGASDSYTRSDRRFTKATTRGGDTRAKDGALVDAGRRAIRRAEKGLTRAELKAWADEILASEPEVVEPDESDLYVDDDVYDLLADVIGGCPDGADCDYDGCSNGRANNAARVALADADDEVTMFLARLQANREARLTADAVFAAQERAERIRGFDFDAECGWDAPTVFVPAGDWEDNSLFDLIDEACESYEAPEREFA